MTYYGTVNRAALYPLLRRINTYLLRWIMRKYKKHSTWKKAIKMLAEAAATRPRYFRTLGLAETGHRMTRTARAV
jgi:RNA-directed DNA polymerase